MPLTQFGPALLPANYPLRRCPHSRLQAPQRILIVRSMALGGVVMMTPLLGALRRAYPEAYISWLVFDKYAEAVDAHPCLDEVIRWDSDFWKMLRSPRVSNWLKNGFGTRLAFEALRLIRQLRQLRIEILINFHPQFTPLILTGARPSKHSIAVFNSMALAERPDQVRRYTQAFLPSDLPTNTAAQVSLALKALQITQRPGEPACFGYTGKDRRAVDRLLAEEKLGARFVLFSPITTWATKTWDEERWAQLGDSLAREPGVTGVAVVGTSQEKAAADRITGRMQTRSCNLSGRLNVRELGALIERAQLVISSDSAAMHIAAAMGTPYIALFGATSPESWAPLEGRGEAIVHPVPCGPCHSMTCHNPEQSKIACMRLITVDRVLQRARVLLRKSMVSERDRSASG